jgi:hypothetical protein
MDAEQMEDSILQIIPMYNKLKEGASAKEIEVIIETEEDIFKGDTDYMMESRRRKNSVGSDQSRSNSVDDSEQGSERFDPSEKKITDEAEV